MKRNIKIKKLFAICLSLILTSNLTIFASSAKKSIQKSTTKTNNNSNKNNAFHKNLLNKKYNQRINLKFSSGDKLLNGVALWIVNNEIMKEIYNKLNIKENEKEENLPFFNYITNTNDPEIHVNIPYDENETFEKKKNDLEKYLKNNFKKMCQSLAEKLDLSNKLGLYKIEKLLKKIEQQISYEITNINNEIKKINNASKDSNKKYYISKGRQFFESEDFKSFIDFLNPNLYEFLKIKLNEENKKNVFSIIGKEISKKELENLKSRLNKMNNLKSNFSKFSQEEKNDSLYSLLNDKYDDYFNNDYYDYLNYYYNDFYTNDDDDDDDDDDYDYDYDDYKYKYKLLKSLNYKSRKSKRKKDKERIIEITKNIKNILYYNINFKDLTKENTDTLNKNKKEYEKYMKNLNLILKNINLNKKQKNNSKINSKNNIESIVGDLKDDYIQLKKILNENKKKGGRNKELKNEMEKILNCLNLSTTFKENEKQNNKELIEKSKEWLPIKIKYIKNLLNNEKLKKNKK